LKALAYATKDPIMPSNITQLRSDDLKAYIDANKEKDYVLIDVRQPMEYKLEHLPGAFFLPLPELETKLFELPSEQDLIFYCRSGKRSMVAATLALEAEITTKGIYNLDGGIMSWYGKTLQDFPKVQIFETAAGFSELLYIAMDLEKGAWRFYDFVKERYAGAPFVRAFDTLSKAETAHAKAIYAHWQGHQENPAPFEELFERLGGEILEGGEALADVLERLDSLEGNPCLNLMELALHIEYSAFDLYRTLADRTQDEKTRETIMTIAQAEKAHMRTLVKALAQCPE
jgi:rhodanese-related sulfurtransferase/rubrerythrin